MIGLIGLNISVRRCYCVWTASSVISISVLILSVACWCVSEQCFTEVSFILFCFRVYRIPESKCVHMFSFVIYDFVFRFTLLISVLQRSIAIPPLTSTYLTGDFSPILLCALFWDIMMYACIYKCMAFLSCCIVYIDPCCKPNDWHMFLF